MAVLVASNESFSNGRHFRTLRRVELLPDELCQPLEGHVEFLLGREGEGRAKVGTGPRLVGHEGSSREEHDFLRHALLQEQELINQC